MVSKLVGVEGLSHSKNSLCSSVQLEINSQRNSSLTHRPLLRPLFLLPFSPHVLGLAHSHGSLYPPVRIRLASGCAWGCLGLMFTGREGLRDPSWGKGTGERDGSCARDGSFAGLHGGPFRCASEEALCCAATRPGTAYSLPCCLIGDRSSAWK